MPSSHPDAAPEHRPSIACITESVPLPFSTNKDVDMPAHQCSRWQWQGLSLFSSSNRAFSSPTRKLIPFPVLPQRAAESISFHIV